jgi:peptidoglycan/LPS O-acetylase OafA/YrhL
LKGCEGSQFAASRLLWRGGADLAIGWNGIAQRRRRVAPESHERFWGRSEVNGRLSSFLNASRWMAAFLVFVGHVRQLVLADYNDIAGRGLLPAALYFVTGLGHEAVMVFFVVSGYLIGGLAITRYQARGFHLLDYGVHRLSRIYTVLMPALLLGGLSDVLGLMFFNHTLLYTAADPYKSSSLNFVIVNNLNVETFLANIAMLEGICAEHLGSNGPLWSLAYEWWYYCIFAAAMVLVVTEGVLRKVIAGAALAALCFGLPHVLVFWGAMWLIGVGAALYGESRLWKPRVWLGLIVFGGALVASRLSHSFEASPATFDVGSFARDFAVALCYAFLTLAFRKDGKALPLAEGHRRLADFSYTLYLIHFPALVFCVALLHDLFGVGFRRQPDLGGLAYFAALAVLLFGYAWVVSLGSEAHTSRVRSALSALTRRFGGQAKLGQSAR